MTLEDLRTYCLKKPGVTEDLPFGPDVLVFRVAKKIFLLTDVDDFQKVNLKCDPERAVELRERYDTITPGYHMNKQHWNTVDARGGIPEKLLRELIDHSYELIRDSLPKKVREELE